MPMIDDQLFTGSTTLRVHDVELLAADEVRPNSIREQSSRYWERRKNCVST
jgi:hypothetical protein